MSIEETWKSDEIKFLRNIHKNGEYFKNDICKECVLSTSNIDDSI